MVTKVIIFLIIFTSSVLASCKEYSNFSNDEIQHIQIQINKKEKFVKHVTKYYLSKKIQKPLTNFNKKKKI